MSKIYDEIMLFCGCIYKIKIDMDFTLLKEDFLKYVDKGIADGVFTKSDIRIDTIDLICNFLKNRGLAYAVKKCRRHEEGRR